MTIAVIYNREFEKAVNLFGVPALFRPPASGARKKGEFVGLSDSRGNGSADGQSE